MKLPSMVYADRKSEIVQTAFKGLNHSESASAGDIYDMENMSSDLYPILAPRAIRRKLTDGAGIQNCCKVGDAIYFTANQQLWKTDRIEQTASDEGSIDMMAATKMVGNSLAYITKMFAFGKRLILHSQYKYDGYYMVYDTESGEVRRMDAEIKGYAGIGNGKLYGVSAEANVIDFNEGVSPTYGSFMAGDGVHITVNGTTSEGEAMTWERDAVIREINSDQTVYMFDEYLFSDLIEKIGSYGNVTITRTAPQFEHICSFNNRLFATNGNTVYASALGDPFNWNVFDGLSTDSWSLETVGGDFTAIVEYLGYLHFFKTDEIHKLYGSNPSEYRLSKTETLGVKEGASNTPAAVNGVLYYLSAKGVCAYTGGYPTVILTPEQIGYYPVGGQGASDGDKYYLKLDQLFVYDTQLGLWHKEDSELTPCFASGYPGTSQFNLFGLSLGGDLWLMGSPAFSGGKSVWGSSEYGIAESAVESYAEFGEEYHDTLNAKKLWRLHIRLWVAKGAKVKISISYDGGKYKVLREFGQTDKRSFVIPIAAKRCDHYRLRIDGVGEYKIYALAREYAVSMGRER